MTVAFFRTLCLHRLSFLDLILLIMFCVETLLYCAMYSKKINKLLNLTSFFTVQSNNSAKLVCIQICCIMYTKIDTFLLFYFTAAAFKVRSLRDLIPTLLYGLIS